jgi:DNA polymerase-3 subunit epsilon
VHIGYLRDLARAAWADQVVIPEERADIVAVARLLGLAPALVDQVIDEERVNAAPHKQTSVTVRGLTLRPGDKVVLTGAMNRERADIVAQAAATGVRVTGAVSKFTAVLVAADPDSLSGKAKKARELGVPVVSESAFLRVLDQLAAVDLLIG